ncbi:restriction endonuclease subunit S [Segatella copri]|uniref:restriction endonuclease subunit S n=1 Tax=Segatella copri TaxID=165179 RepID=UPI00294AD3F9|nr:restriction endonuclease subunit S [Segatella copri]WOF98644.1 restriction endonuclease subunit S [Segatella copri]
MEWKEVTLGEISSKIGDGLHGTPKYDDEGPYYFINGNNLNCGKIIIKDDTKRVGIDEFVKNQKELNEQTLLVSINGTIGNVAKYNNEPCILGKSACYINVIKEVDKEFIYYVLTSANFKRNITNEATGTTIKNVSLKQMREYKFNIPCNIADQRRIASILSSLDRKIELNNKINADLEEMAQAIFKNWFVDFEPFKDGKFVDSELGMIPEGWKVGCLGDMGNIVCGKTPSKANSNYYGGDIPFIKIPDMHGNVFVENSEDRLTEEGSLSQIKKLIPPYSLMVSCIATVGLVSINTKPSHTNQQINTVIPHNKSALFYLYQHIKNNEEFLKNMGRGGTTTLNVNTKSFSNIRLLIPSEIALDQFHGIVEGLFKKIELNMHESRTLSLLCDTLLPRLMSGELEVPE